jgi:hypothetical protein
VPDVPHPVVVPRQAEAVLAAVDAALAKAVVAQNALLLVPRVTGPSRKEHEAEFRVARAVKRKPAAVRPVALDQLLLPQAGPWPRWFLAAGTSRGAPTPVLRVLWSPNARTPYGQWARLSLLPGASLPTVPQPAGAPVLDAASAQGLVRSPGDVLLDYARLLMRGFDDPVARRFARDAFATEVTSRLVQDRKGAGRKDVATVTSRQRRGRDATLALRTGDGGALVIGTLEQIYEVTVRRGKGSVTFDDRELAALFGARTIKERLTRVSLQTLAFHVPSAATGGQVRLLAASKADVRASGR